MPPAYRNETDSTINPLQRLHDLSYTLGNCRVLVYNRFQPDTFGDDLLSRLYDLCLLSRPTHPFGTLPETQCGMSDLTRDAMISYWASKSILLLTVIPATALPATAPSKRMIDMLPDNSRIAGFAYLPAILGAPANPPGQPQPIGPRSATGAYAFFRDWWGTPEIEVLAMLGLAHFFHSYHLAAIHGQRYTRNALTARFMSRFGFTDTGTLPFFLVDFPPGAERIPANMQLVSCTLSTLLHEDFIAYVERELESIADIDSV